MIKIAIVLSMLSIGVCVALVAAPVVFGVVATTGVSVAMLVCIYQIVTSASSVTGERYQPPSPELSATVDASEVTSC